MNTKLLIKLEDELNQNYEKAKEKYKATAYKRILNKYKGEPLKTIDYILSEEKKYRKPLDGFFRLKEVGLLDLSVENTIIKPQYRTLFKKEDVEFCKYLLSYYGEVDTSLSILDSVLNKFFELCDLLESHHLSPTWLIPSIIVLAVGVIRFLFYMYEFGRCNYWNINSNAINISINNFFDLAYYICIILIIVIYISILNKMIIFDKNRKIKSIFLTLLTNFGAFSMNLSLCILLLFEIKSALALSLIIHIPCTIYSIYLKYKKRKDKTKEINESSVISNLVFYFILFIIFVLIIYSLGYNHEKSREEFSVINRDGIDYIILYSNNEYYYLSQYDKINNIIDTNKKLIISIENNKTTKIKISKPIKE